MRKHLTIRHLQNAQKFLEDKQYENAIIELNKILESDPDNVKALNEKGKIRLIQGKYVKALQNFEKTLEFEPDDIVALNGLGVSQFNLNQYDDALDSFNSVLNRDVSDSLDLILVITIIGSVTSVLSFILVMMKIKENRKLQERVLIADEQIEDLVDKFMKRQNN